MKAVQIGILAALLVCAGLLFKVYRGQQAPAPAVTPAQNAAVPASGATPTGTAPQAEPPAPSAPAPAEPQKKPSPWRPAAKKSGQNLAANRAPEPAAAAPAQAPAPAASTAPQKTETAALNPPPAAPEAPPAPRQPQHVTIPAGTVITVRLAETVSSEKNQPGDAFSATLDQPLIVEGLAIAERGARVQGKIVDAVRAGRVKGVAQLSLQLLKLHTSDGQDISLSTEKFAKEGPTSKGSDAKKVGIGAALGAAIGAIAGGGKGAAIGAGVGGAAGAGTVAATRGKAAELPVETRLTFRLQEAVTVTERIR
jgi:hypothetical protein